MIDICCPQCRARWKLDDSAAGTRGHCPRCRCVLDVPRGTESGVPAAVPSPMLSERPLAKIPVQCPQCRTTWNVDSGYAGITAMCPRCRCVLKVPEAERPAPVEPDDPGYEVVEEPAKGQELESIETDLVPLEDEPELLEEDVPEVEAADEPDERLTTRPRGEVRPRRRPHEEESERPPRRKQRRPLRIPYRQEEEPRSRGISVGFLEDMFAGTHLAALVLLGLCCWVVALPLGIVGLICTQDPQARRNALIMTLVASIWLFIAILVNLGRMR